MNNKKYIVTCFVLLLGFFVLGLFGCTKPVRLDAPTTLSLEDGVLKWDAVKNATGYVVFLDKNEYNAAENQLSLPDDLPTYDTLYVEIKSIGDEDKYIDSDWREFSIELNVNGYDENGFYYFLKDDGYKICRNNGSI